MATIPISGELARMQGARLAARERAYQIYRVGCVFSIGIGTWIGWSLIHLGLQFAARFHLVLAAGGLR